MHDVRILSLMMTLALVGCGAVENGKKVREDPTEEPRLSDALVNELETALHEGRLASGADIALATVIAPNDAGEEGVWSSMAGVGDVKSDALYRIGSVSKLIFAGCVLQLVDEGTLSLDDTLDAWFPSVPNAASITLRDMLQHTSGIVEYFSLTEFQDDFINDPLHTFTADEIVTYVVAEPPDFEPGDDWGYSNTNYYLLGAIVEDVTGASVATLLRERVSEPLGLTHTFYDPEDELPSALVPGVSGAFPGEADVSTLFDSSVAGAAGAVVSSTKDVAKILRAMWDGTLIPEAQRDTWLDLRSLGNGFSYGSGVMMVRLDATTAGYGHDGSIFGANTMAFHFPDTDTTVVEMINDDDADINPAFVELLDVAVP